MPSFALLSSVHAVPSSHPSGRRLFRLPGRFSATNPLPQRPEILSAVRSLHTRQPARITLRATTMTGMPVITPHRISPHEILSVLFKQPPNVSRRQLRFSTGLSFVPENTVYRRYQRKFVCRRRLRCSVIGHNFNKIMPAGAVKLRYKHVR